MAATPHDSTGTTFSFAGTSYTVTNIVYSLSDVSGTGDVIDISHLGQTTGATMLSQIRPLKPAAGNGADTGKEVSIDYIGSAAIIGGTSGTLTIAGGLSVSGNATCLSSSVTLAMNEVIRGSASFRVA
jgi:hypothetical protein